MEELTNQTLSLPLSGSDHLARSSTEERKNLAPREAVVCMGNIIAILDAQAIEYNNFGPSSSRAVLQGNDPDTTKIQAFRPARWHSNLAG